MKTKYKIRELLLPGNWNTELARELLEDAERELSSACPECVRMEEFAMDACDCEPDPPTRATYDHLKEQSAMRVKLRDVDAVWEKVEGVDGKVVRATLWLDQDVWNDCLGGGEK